MANKRLKELLEEWDMWGFDSYKLEPDPVSEMARRLWDLDERHSEPWPRGNTGGDRGWSACGGCGNKWPCPDRRILDGENSDE
jgi:hypothetical protein